jgi:5'(3')-deoxyribonucleotidase
MDVLLKTSDSNKRKTKNTKQQKYLLNLNCQRIAHRINKNMDLGTDVLKRLATYRCRMVEGHTNEKPFLPVSRKYTS